MSEPGFTGSGESLIVVCTSALAATVVDVVALSLAPLESHVAELTVAAVLMTVPAAGEPLTAVTRVKVSGNEPVTANDGLLQLTVPLLPTPGSVQLQPEGALTEEKTRPEGSVVVHTAVEAASGPLLATSTV